MPSFLQSLYRTFLLAAAGVLLAAALAVGWLFWDLRNFDWQTVNLDPSGKAMVLLAANGSELSWDGARHGAPIPKEAIPKHLIDALVAIEDRRYYRHFGIDLYGIMRAAVSNWRSGHVVEGGSTLTQQFARTRHLNREQTYQRKSRELAIAMWIDWTWEKDDILAAYLNEVYFGSGVFGVSAAAAEYFGKSVGELSLAQSAILAAVVNAPSNINPHVDLAGAIDRARRVLVAMVETGAATQQEADVASGQLAALSPMQTEGRGPASWFGDWVRQQVLQTAAGVDTRQVDLITATTSLDLQLQAIAEEVVTELIAQKGAARKAGQAALVALAPDGAVLAMVGGTDYQVNRFNRATQAKRQPGSLFKLFVYYAALKNGWKPSHTVIDEPMQIDGWEPTNFDGAFGGEMTLAHAFASSRNIPSVQLAQDVGLDQVEAAARDLGITSRLTLMPSLALGASEVTLLEITAAFASVRAGAKVAPRPITRLKLGSASLAFPVSRPQAEPILPEHQHDLVALLRGVVTNGTGGSANLPGVFVAGKTGTSQHHRDGWFVGFTENLTVGVWVGNDDNSPMDGVTGGTLPADIWREFVSRAHDHVPQQSSSMPHVSSADHSPTEEVTSDQIASAKLGQALCNIDACSTRYRSFRQSDCTFQPYTGSRQLCTVGNDAGSATRVVVASVPRSIDQAAIAGICNINACTSKYRSFRAADCTYQPNRGGRRLCAAVSSRGFGIRRVPQDRPSNVTALVEVERSNRPHRIPLEDIFDRLFLLPSGRN